MTTTDTSSIDGDDRSLLYIDMAYTTDEVRRRKHEQFFESRHAGGFFGKVWGLHPLADRADRERPRRIEWVPFSERQTVIEGAAELYAWPKFLLPLNLLLSQAKLLSEIVRLVRRERIRAIAATDPLYSGLFGMAVSRICRVPLAIHVVANYDDLYEVTGSPMMPMLLPSRRLERLAIRFVLSHADLVAPATKTLVEYAIRNGARSDRISIFRVSKHMSPLHHRPPQERPTPREALERLGIRSSGPFLLSVARLAPAKFVDDAIRAMKVVFEGHPTAVGLIAGDGPLRSELESLAERLGIGDRVHFLGKLDQGMLSELIPGCVTVSPLTGMALFECALGGSPVVAYKYDEIIHELVQDGQTGFLVDFGNHEEMGNRLLQILKDDEMRGAMSRNVRTVGLGYADLDQLYQHEAKSYSEMFVRAEQKGVARRHQLGRDGRKSLEGERT